MMLVSVGDQIPRGSYRFHSRFERAVNYVLRGRLISVVDASIGGGPLNVVLNGLSSDTSRFDATPLEVDSDAISFGYRQFQYSERHRYSSNLEFEVWDPDRLKRNLLTFGALLQAASPPKSLAFLLDKRRAAHFLPGFEQACARQISCGVRLLFGGCVLEGITALKGCGPGLTPSGDDFIAGLLVALHLRRRLFGENCLALADSICRTARTQNPFSNTFISLAREGLMFERLKELVLSLIHGRAPDLKQAALKLFSVGGSSGADLGTGLYLALGPRVSAL
jgi:hypothetical protein